MNNRQPVALTPLNGRYQLYEALGRGGMGTVYRAEDMRTGTSVAIKMLSPGSASDSNFLRLFNREVLLLTRLHHPGIVTILDSGVYQTRPYLVMEYVPGESLANRQARYGPAPIVQALNIALQAANALGTAHRARITHCDVKPANLLLKSSQPPASGQAADWSAHIQVKVVDFGIAQSATTTGLFPTGQVFGTARYMAPEQMIGEPVTPASDVYSLGLVLYELLTGQTPFPGKSMQEQAMQRLSITPADPRHLRTDIPPALARVIGRMLARNPAQRYADGDQVAAALRALQAGAAGMTVSGPPLPGTFGTAGSAPGINAALTQISNGTAALPGAKVGSGAPHGATPALHGVLAPQRGRKRRRLWPWLLLLLGLLLAVLGVQQAFPATNSLARGTTPRPTTAPVPPAPTSVASAPQGGATSGQPITTPKQTTPEPFPTAHVPALLFLKLPNARHRLEQAGLRVGSVSSVSVPLIKPGLVVRQSVSPNRTVPAGSAIDLVISARQNTGNNNGGEEGNQGNQGE